MGAGPGRIGAPATNIAPDVLAGSGEPAVRLAVLGDVGTGDAAEWETAQLATGAAASDPFDALILLGDNVYPNGDPARLDATVFEPLEPILQQGRALVPVLGNHDVRDGNAAGQVETLGMPGRWYATEIGPLLIVALESNLVDDPGQQQWLESTLRSSNAQWTMVAMHHPPYSAGVKTRPTDRAGFTAYSASVLHWVDIIIRDDRIDITANSADGPFDHTTIDSTTVTSSTPLGDGLASNLTAAGIALGIGAFGAMLWILALLTGWYAPPQLVVDQRRALLTGTTVGMLTTIIGFAAATTLLVL